MNQGHLSDDALSERQLARRGAFLRAITFGKPYDALTNKALLARSGLNIHQAKTVVAVSFFLSFSLLIAFGFLVLWTFRGITNTSLGFVFYLALILAFHYLIHYYSAKFLVRYFKAKQ